MAKSSGGLWERIKLQVRGAWNFWGIDGEDGIGLSRKDEVVTDLANKTFEAEYNSGLTVWQEICRGGKEIANGFGGGDSGNKLWYQRFLDGLAAMINAAICTTRTTFGKLFNTYSWPNITISSVSVLFFAASLPFIYIFGSSFLSYIGALSWDESSYYLAMYASDMLLTGAIASSAIGLGAICRAIDQSVAKRLMISAVRKQLSANPALLQQERSRLMLESAEAKVSAKVKELWRQVAEKEDHINKLSAICEQILATPDTEVSVLDARCRPHRININELQRQRSKIFREIREMKNSFKVERSKLLLSIAEAPVLAMKDRLVDIHTGEADKRIEEMKEDGKATINDIGASADALHQHFLDEAGMAMSQDKQEKFPEDEELFSLPPADSDDED